MQKEEDKLTKKRIKHQKALAKNESREKRIAEVDLDVIDAREVATGAEATAREAPMK